MATTPPSSALFEHVFPEELTLALERGCHVRQVAVVESGIDLDQLNRWLCSDIEPLEFEVLPPESAHTEEYLPALRSIFDAIETWLSSHALSPRERCVIRAQNDQLARALVAEMRRRYTGDPAID